MDDPIKDTQLAIGEILGSTKYLVRQVEEVKADFRDFRAEIKAEQEKTNERVHKLERFMWRATGMAVAASTIIPIIITAVGWWLIP